MKGIEFIGKCVYVEKLKTLVVGDLHFGFEESLNKSGVFVGRQMYDEIVLEFEEIFEKMEEKELGVEKIILLGDVKQDFSRAGRQEWKELLDFFEYLGKKAKEIIITQGNHDNYLKTIVGKSEEKVKVVDYYVEKEFGFMHGDKRVEEIEEKEIKNWFMGHGHPALKLSDGNKEEKYKCFLVGKYENKEVVIVPSFIEYHEGSDPREDFIKMGWDFNFGKFEVFVIGENLESLDFGMLKNIKN